MNPGGVPLIVHLYTRCFNDAAMLPFFFRHYDRFVTHYFIFDDGSTDESVSLIRSHPRAELCPMPPRSDPNSRVRSATDLQDSFWQASRGKADWVVVTDVDEHLSHPNICNYLLRCKRAGITIIPAVGFEMVSEAMPASSARLSQEVTRGAPDPMCNKLSVFNPDAVLHTHFAPGRHSAQPEGDIVAPARDELLLLHYHHVGFDRVVRRHEVYQERQRPGDLERRWGHQYALGTQGLRAKWTTIERNSVDLARVDGHREAKSDGGWWHAGRRVEPSDRLLDRVHGWVTRDRRHGRVGQWIGRGNK